jgi:type I restriction enzyme S subunit
MSSQLLADVAQVIMGQSPPSSTYNTVGKGLPFYQGKTDFGDMFPKPRVYCTEPSRIAEAGDILVSVRAPVGPTNVSAERSCIGRGISAIRVGKNLERDFLLYFLRFYEPELAKAGTGSTFAAISREDLETIRIPLPSLTEQKRIASLMSRADRLRQLRRTAHDLSDSVLQSVFLEMFGDPVEDSNKWQKEALIDIINPERPITYGILMPGENLPNGVPYVRVVDIWDGKIDVANVRRTSEEIDKQYKRSRLLPGDLLLTIRGQVGRLAIVPPELKGANITQDTARLDPIRSICNAQYLFGCMLMSSFQHLMQTLTRGVAVTGINLGDVKDLPIPLPPLSKQEEFAGVVSRVESLRGQMSETERQADELFASLLSEAFHA